MKVDEFLLNVNHVVPTSSNVLKLILIIKIIKIVGVYCFKVSLTFNQMMELGKLVKLVNW